MRLTEVYNILREYEVDQGSGDRGRERGVRLRKREAEREQEWSREAGFAFSGS